MIPILEIIQLEREQLVESIRLIVSQKKEKQIEMFFTNIQKSYQIRLTENLLEYLNKPEEDMWPKISSIYHKEKEIAISEIQKLLTDFDCPIDEIKKNEKQMDNVSFQYLHSLIKDHAKNIDLLMNQRFKARFEIDQKAKAPRRWKPNDNVTEEWKKSKTEAELLLDLFGCIRLTEKTYNLVYFECDPDFPQIKVKERDIENKDYIVLTRQEGERHLQRFRDNAETSYNYAMKELERAEVKSQIPYYFFALLFILGWNELWWFIQMLLFNPLGLFFMIITALSAFAVWRLNLWPVLLQTGKMVANEGHTYIKFKIQEELRKLNQQQNNNNIPTNNAPPKNKTD